jgi:hypothetical protein
LESPILLTDIQVLRTWWHENMGKILTEVLPSFRIKLSPKNYTTSNNNFASIFVSEELNVKLC